MWFGSDWISWSASRSERSAANGRSRSRSGSVGAPTGPAYRRPHGYGWSMASASETLEVDGREIRVTNPEKVYFPDAPGGPITKLDLVRYWVEVSRAALVGCRDRPTTLHRFPDGA